MLYIRFITSGPSVGDHAARMMPTVTPYPKLVRQWHRCVQYRWVNGSFSSQCLAQYSCCLTLYIRTAGKHVIHDTVSTPTLRRLAYAGQFTARQARALQAPASRKCVNLLPTDWPPLAGLDHSLLFKWSRCPLFAPNFADVPKAADDRRGRSKPIEPSFFASQGASKGPSLGSE